MARNKVVFDAGKGFETLRAWEQIIYLANNTQIVPLGNCPAEFRVTRVLVGSAVATALTSIDIIALPLTSALDTAVAAGNSLITQITTLAAGKTLTSATLSGNSFRVAGDSVIVAVVVGTGAAATAPVFIQVEYDVIGRTYAAYDDGDTSDGTYPAGSSL